MQVVCEFVRKTLLNRLTTGAISLLGKVGDVQAPHIVLPLTVEPSKPRLCHDARYLNLWMRDKPFTLDSLNDLQRYVAKDSYQTVLDDKSGSDHILLTDQSRTFFGIQWGGWYFTYISLPFGWKISPYVYHTTRLLATNLFRSIGIPCLLISVIDTMDNFKFQIFLVAFYLVRMGYFLGLSKSILTPLKIVPYLGFLADSSMEVFHLIPEKKHKFVTLVQETLQSTYASVKTLQRLVGKCTSFSRAVPAVRLFTREMNAAISKGIRSQKPILLRGSLREEISHLLFLETWNNPLPWRDERHIQVSVATDASVSGWWATILSLIRREVFEYWSGEELT